MIDEKKIEKAIEDYVRYSSIEDEYPGIEGNAFKAGAEWAINEFLKDLWHSASEKPVPVMGCNNGVLVELNEIKKPLHCGK